jgi:GNAT superfamily N-acetyltransferase
LFERAGSSCYCRYFHFAGDKHAWLERSALSPELNRRELLLAIEQDSLEARGLVALTPDDAIVGWMKLAPAAALAKLWTQRPYRGLSNVERESSDCYTIGCFLVDPNQRRRGVARALVQAAPAIARQWGARWLQAVPYRAAMAPAELIWTGPAELLRECGFREVGGVGPYPVLRLDL